MSNTGNIIKKTNKALSYDEVTKIFESYDCKLITTFYTHKRQKLEYIASCGHLSIILFESFRKGGGIKCKICVTNELKAQRINNLKKFQYKSLSLTEVQEIFKKANCKLLSDNYDNNEQILYYIAQCGHNNKISLTCFQRGQGILCSDCSINKRIITKSKTQFKKTYKKLLNLINLHGGKLLTSIENFNGCFDKINIICELNHEFLSNYESITKGIWCPTCLSINNQVKEPICRRIFEFLLNVKFEKIRPEWLRYNGYKLELDGYNEEIKTAFEVNGIQHYKQIDWFKNHDLNYQIKKDKFKEKICKQKEIILIIIPYNVGLYKLFDYIKEECIKHNLKINNNEMPKDIMKLNNEKDEIYKKIINKCGELKGKCFDNQCIPSELMTFECKYRHKFKRYAQDLLKNNNWCKRCKTYENKPIIELDKDSHIIKKYINIFDLIEQINVDFESLKKIIYGNKSVNDRIFKYEKKYLNNKIHDTKELEVKSYLDTSQGKKILVKSKIKKIY